MLSEKNREFDGEKNQVHFVRGGTGGGRKLPSFIMPLQ